MSTPQHCCGILVCSLKPGIKYVMVKSKKGNASMACLKTKMLPMDKNLETDSGENAIRNISDFIGRIERYICARGERGGIFPSIGESPAFILLRAVPDFFAGMILRKIHILKKIYLMPCGRAG